MKEGNAHRGLLLRNHETFRGWWAPGRDVASTFLLLTSLLLPTPAAGVRYQVAGTTAAAIDELQAWDGSLLPRRSVLQQVHLGAYDLASDGTGRLWLTGMLQIEGEFGIPAAELEQLDRSRARQLTIPFLYLEGRDLWHGRLDLTVGRQLRVESTDFVLLDGGHCALRTPLHLGMTGYAGWPVRRDVSWLGTEALEPDGGWLLEEQGLVWGGGFFLHGLSWLAGRLAYQRQSSDEALHRSVLHAALTLRPLRPITLDGGWTRDLLGQRDEELLAQLGLTWPTRWRWSLQFRQQLPRLDAGSIFSVFRLEPTRSWGLQGEVALESWQVVWGGRVLQRLAPPPLADPLAEQRAAEPAPAPGGELRVLWWPAAAWRLHGESNWQHDGVGLRGLSTLGASWLPGWPAEATLEGSLRWLHLGESLGSWGAGETFALDLSGSLVVWERARLQLVAEQAMGPWRPYWLRVLALLDFGYWR